MDAPEDKSESASPNLDDRMKSLAAFEKLERAMQLVDEVIKEYPKLKDLQVGPLLRSFADGLKIFSAENSELGLQELMVRHDWWVGQRFYVRTISRANPEQSFIVLPKQDIPEGVVIIAKLRKGIQARDGQAVAIDLEIIRTDRKPKWWIRAIDHE